MHDGKNTLNGNAGAANAAAIAGMPSAPSVHVPDPPAQTQAPTEKQPRVARPRTSRTRTPIYDPLIGIVGALISTAAAGLIWWVGAILTLTFLQTRLGINVAGMGNWKWLIPISITGIEIAFWPRKAQSFNFRVLFLLVAGADVLTSIDGGRAWLADRGMSQVWLTWALGGVAAFLCAFWPERLIRSAAEHFWTNGKVLIRDLRVAFA
jgi:hypothetical protein